MDRHLDAALDSRDRKSTLGSLFLMGFEGTTVTPHIRSLIEDYRLGAVYLNATNFVSAEQAIMLIKELQTTAHNSQHRYPLLIAMDQENGLVKSINDSRWITQFPSSLGVAATKSANNAYHVSLATGRELSCIGVNWILGPGLDVILDKGVPGLGSRSFGSDPEEVAILGRASVQGFRDAGIACLAKHFPLGGNLTFDESSMMVPVVSETLEQLRQKVLRPFQEAIREKVDAVMVSGCAISSIGPKFMHACFSRRVVTDLLKHQLGYSGVVVSECLEMESTARHLGVGQAAVMAVHAGCDVLNVCQSLPLQLEAFASLSLALDSGALSWDLVQKSADRVVRMRSTHTSWSRALNPPGLQQLALTRPQHMKLATQVYEESITLLRDDNGSIPLSNVLSAQSTLLILSPILYHWGMSSRPDKTHQQHHSTAGYSIQFGEEYFQDFGRALACYDVGEVVHTSYTSHGVRAEHENLIEKADAIVILVADANRNQYQLGFAKHVTALCKLRQRTSVHPEPDKVLVLVSLSSAYDTSAAADGIFRTHLCTYDSSPAALHSLSRVLGGEIKPSGRVPGLQPLSKSEQAPSIEHRQAWLVEEFCYTRDQVPLQDFLRGILESDEGSIVTPMESDCATAISTAHFLSENGTFEYQTFVVRNTSTGAIYGIASACRFPSSSLGCLGAILVDPKRRALSIGRDLHTSAFRYLAQMPGIESIQLGAPINALFPGLPLLSDTALGPSANFFTKMGWKLEDNAQSLRIFSLVHDGVDEHQPLSYLVRQAENNDIIFERVTNQETWSEVLRHVQESSASTKDFDTLIYREASSRNDPPIRLLAREKHTGKLIASTIMLSKNEALATSFPLIMSLSESTAAILCPVLSPAVEASSLKSLVRGLFAFALLEAWQLQFKSCFVHPIAKNLNLEALEDIGFRKNKVFLVAKRNIANFI